jgi:hypothetical protein
VTANKITHVRPVRAVLLYKRKIEVIGGLRGPIHCLLGVLSHVDGWNPAVPLPSLFPYLFGKSKSNKLTTRGLLLGRSEPLFGKQIEHL